VPNDVCGLSIISGALILGSNGSQERSTSKLLNLARLEAELNAVVDRLESDWQLYGIVRKELAEELRELLMRARSL